MVFRLVFVLALFLCANAHAAPVRIVVDAGHGGDKPGARAPNGVYEKSICLSLAQKLGDALRKAGAQVLMTRESDVDVSLPDRVRLAKEFHPDLFVSLHANSMATRRLRSKTNGVEVIFLSTSASGEEARALAAQENADSPTPQVQSSGGTLSFILNDLKRSSAHADSSRLAYAVHHRLVEATEAKDEGVQQAPLYVLTGIDVPAILIEVGFISHPVESMRLQSSAYQRKLVNGIARGIWDFVKQVAPRDARRPVVATPELH